MSVEIQDSATVELKGLGFSLAPGSINPVIGRAGVNKLKSHFLNLERTHPNKQGWPRQHFHAACARATHFDLLPDGVRLSVNEPGAGLRYHGGTVSPGKNTSSWSGKPTRLLTIPARAEAYGKRAGEFFNLSFAILGGKPALVENLATNIRKKKGKNATGYEAVSSTIGAVYYWLVPKAVFKPDPGFIPTEDEFRQHIYAELMFYLEGKNQNE